MSTNVRSEIVAVAYELDAAGLMPNKSGNVSRRTDAGFAITPAAVPYRDLTPDHIVEIGDTPIFSGDGTATSAHRWQTAPGGDATVQGLGEKSGVSPISGKFGVSPSSPSSEWRMHGAIYRARADVAAIVHTHSPRATALACAGLGIPPFHYMIALAGGDVRCMPYQTFGTAGLAASAVRGLEGRRAVLLANHGVVAVGPSLRVAQAVALEVENLADQWLALRAAGLEPQLLDDAELARVLEKFAGYGRLD